MALDHCFAPAGWHRRVRLALTATLFAFAAALGSPALAQTPVKFSLNFKPDGSNAPWFLAHERGYFKDAGLNVAIDASAGTGDVLQRLASGTYDAGFADIGALAEFASRNPDQAPVAVMVIYANSPLSVVTLRKTGIAKPADLEGRRMAAPGIDGAVRMFPAFAKATGIDASKVLNQNVDIRVRETLLHRGDVDGAFGFDSSIWFNLRTLGVKQEDVVFMRYSDYGLDLYGNALMVSRRFLKENPQAVAALVKVTARAWRESLADPKAAIAALAKRDPLIDQGIELEKLQWLARNQIESPLTRAEGLGAVDPKRLGRQIDVVADAFKLASKPTVEAIYDARFLPPRDERRLP
jgi:NitT/TauT family transport system substrate-binding protein